MTWQTLSSVFPYIRGKLCFIFYQCTLLSSYLDLYMRKTLFSFLSMHFVVVLFGSSLYYMRKTLFSFLSVHFVVVLFGTNPPPPPHC
jgi:hypothetical protein